MKLPSFLSWGRKSSIVTTGSLYKELLANASSKSGVAINWKTALQASTALACARVIANGIAQVPFKLCKERPDGGRDPAKDHPLYEIVSLKPNAWQTSFGLRQQIAMHLVFMGNAYVYISRGLRGQIVELLPFEPQLVTVKTDGWQRKYEVYAGGGKSISVSHEDMWHLQGLSWDGVSGLDGVKLAREVISLSLAMEEHGGRMFSNGARPGGILSTPAKLSPDQRNDLKAVWAEMQEGSENAFKSAILHGGLTWTPLAQTGVDSQHLEQRRFQVEETCRAFGVYPVKVGHSDKAATYASVQDTSIQHVVDTLGPWYKNIEDSAAVSLLSDKERAEGYYFKHTVQGLMRGASKDRAEYYSKALGSGGSPAWMTQDEIRALEELNPMGGSAAVLPIPTNVNKGVSDGNKAP